jgi:hypothetical protein
MYQVIWDFWPYKLNPRYKCFEKRSTNWIFKVWTCKSGFASLPAWICKDLGFANLDFQGFILCYRTKDLWKRPNLWKFRSQIESMIRIFKDRTCKSVKSDLTITKWNKPFWSQDSWPRYKMNPWIRKTNPQVHNSLIWFPQP